VANRKTASLSLILVTTLFRDNQRGGAWNHGYLDWPLPLGESGCAGLVGCWGESCPSPSIFTLSSETTRWHALSSDCHLVMCNDMWNRYFVWHFVGEHCIIHIFITWTTLFVPSDVPFLGPDALCNLQIKLNVSFQSAHCKRSTGKLINDDTDWKRQVLTGIKR